MIDRFMRFGCYCNIFFDIIDCIIVIWLLSWYFACKCQFLLKVCPCLCMRPAYRYKEIVQKLIKSNLTLQMHVKNISFRLFIYSYWFKISTFLVCSVFPIYCVEEEARYIVTQLTQTHSNRWTPHSSSIEPRNKYSISKSFWVARMFLNQTVTLLPDCAILSKGPKANPWI